MELAGIEPSLVLEDADEQTQDELAGILVEEVLEGGRTESTSAATVSAFAARRRGGAYTGTLNVSSSSGGGDNVVRTSSYVRIMLGRKDGMKDSNDRQQRVKGLPDPTTSPGSAAAVRGPSIAVQQTEPVAVLLHAGDGSICLGIALVVRCFVKGKEVPSLRDDEMVTTSAVELGICALATFDKPRGGGTCLRWNGDEVSSLRGRVTADLVQPLNPAATKLQSGQRKGEYVHDYEIHVVNELTATMWSEKQRKKSHFPKMSVTIAFGGAAPLLPYRFGRDTVGVVAMQSASSSSASASASASAPTASLFPACKHCMKIPANKTTKTWSGLVGHLGAEMIEHPEIFGPSACGLCGGENCTVWLTSGSSAKVVVRCEHYGAVDDLQKTVKGVDGRVISFGLKSAGKTTAARPCTNVPMKCENCPNEPHPTYIWSFAMAAHYADKHSTVAMTSEMIGKLTMTLGRACAIQAAGFKDKAFEQSVGKVVAPPLPHKYLGKVVPLDDGTGVVTNIERTADSSGKFKYWISVKKVQAIAAPSVGAVTRKRPRQQLEGEEEAEMTSMFSLADLEDKLRPNEGDDDEASV